MAIILGDAAEAEAETDVDPAVWKQIMDEYNEFGENAAGVIGGGEALHPPSSAVGVKVAGKGGALTRTDAPFAEAKEVIGGFYLLDCADIDEAVGWAAQIPGAWHGRVVVQPCVDFSAAG